MHADLYEWGAHGGAPDVRAGARTWRAHRGSHIARAQPSMQRLAHGGGARRAHRGLRSGSQVAGAQGLAWARTWIRQPCERLIPWS